MCVIPILLVMGISLVVLVVCVGTLGMFLSSFFIFFGFYSEKRLRREDCRGETWGVETWRVKMLTMG